jgi:hypothetical protein
MAKQIQVQCPREIADIIVEALQWFVAQYYPHGADECSIAAREALLNLAERFRQQLVVEGRSSYSSRTRAFLCEAVNTYTRMLEQGSGQSYAHRRALIIEVCRGLSDGAGYAAATQTDQHPADVNRS